MSTNPEFSRGATPFGEEISVEPAVTLMAPLANQFKLSLYLNGVELGWLGQNSNEWAMIVNDVNAALTLELYPYNGVNYYRRVGTSRYMSVSNRAYVGFYRWGGATGFTWEGSRLKSNYNGQHLSYDNRENEFLTCWDAYGWLDVYLK